MVLSATALETAALGASLVQTGVDATGSWPATRLGELNGVPVALVVSGLGKANAAAALAAVVARSGSTVRAVVQVGVGGAYPAHADMVAHAALAASETDLDLGVGSHPDWREVESLAVPGDETTSRIDLAGAANTRAIEASGLPSLAFATSDSVTSDPELAAYLGTRFGVAVESMEGAGASRAAAALGVPFVELRGVSNLVGERDKRIWRMSDAVQAACGAAPQVLTAVWEVVR